MASHTLENGALALLQGLFVAGTTRVDLLLVDDTHVYDAEAVYVDDVSADELAGAGYARATLTGVAASVTSHVPTVVANNVTWAAISPVGAEKAAGAYIFIYNADDSAARLLWFIDGPDITLDGSEVTIKFGGGATSGAVARLTVS